MSEMTDVYLRITYRKDNGLRTDDILDDIDMYDAISMLEYYGISYEDEENLILRAYANYSYTRTFEPSELRDELFEAASLNGIQEIHYIFCNFSMNLDIIDFGIISLDIGRGEVHEKIMKKEVYTEALQEKHPDLYEEYACTQESEEYERLDEIMEQIGERMSLYCYEEFLKFIEEVSLPLSI